MPQVQDDLNQVQSNNSTDVTGQQPNHTTQPPASSTASSQSANSDATIDELLRKLDELSKQIEEKEKEKTEADNSIKVPDFSHDPVEPRDPTQITPQAAPAPSAPTDVQVTPVHIQETPTSAPKKSEDSDFDLDAFLADLEKKIDDSMPQPHEPVSNSQIAKKYAQIKEAKQKAASETDTSKNPDFRKNRTSFQAADVEPEAPVVNTPFTGLLAEEKPGLAAGQPLTSLPAVKPMPQLDAADDSELLARLNRGKEQDESLEAQNIFDLLGIVASEEEKEKFLNELEDLIFDDFLNRDVPLLLTSSEYQNAQNVMADADKQGKDPKEAILEFLNGLLPNLESLLFDKALQLKKEMVMERIKHLEADSQLLQDPTKKSLLQQVKTAIQGEKWLTVVKLLQQLS